MNYINVPEKKIPVVAEADLVVIGGGPAGIGAALRAGRAGAKVIVVEKFGSLGGANVTGWCRINTWGKHIAGEIWQALKDEGYAAKVVDVTPDLLYDRLFHWNAHPLQDRVAVKAAQNLWTFDTDIAAYKINEMMEEAGVRLMLRSLFVDAVVEDGSIKAAIVENASGQQAIRGTVFADTTGVADVVARIGAPYTKAGSPLGPPICMGLMWKMVGVDYQKLTDYQKSDPELNKLIEDVGSKGELPYYSPKKTAEGATVPDIMYSGHPRPEIATTTNTGRGEIDLWMPSIYEWALDGADNAEDVTKAEISIRKQIVSELKFLKKHVPGFENADISGISQYLGIRESRHPIGEYVLTREDIDEGHEFDDVVMERETRAGKTRNVPYRCLLPKTVDNLLVAGDDICADHFAAFISHSFNTSINLGEIAGIAATLAIENKTTPKALDYPVLKNELVAQGILSE